MFRFAHPAYFFLLIPAALLVVVFIYASISRKKNIKLWGNPEVLAPLMPNVSYFRPYVKFYMSLLALILIVVMLAQPQFGSKEENVKKKGIEVVVALDVSNSMMAQDIKPNRLEKSKQILSKLIDGMSNDKIGLIVFAGDAYIQLPITTDYVSAKMFLSSINTSMVPRQGTAIGSAIDMAIKSFGPKTSASRAIVVITDGENHEDDAVEAAKLAAKSDIKVYVVGMGSPDGAPIPMGGSMSFLKDKDGNVVVSKLDETMGNEIAKAGDGVYVRADNTNNATKVITSQLDRLKKSEMESKVYSSYDEQFQSFAFFALFLLLLETVIFNRKNKTLSKINIFDI